ncbi:MAG: winged helix-turn-helix transcriptional regulator [Candidatus Pacebacteria bacterium]|nr:winged helix-turn-helix transcriptional regulator [Candidatus Paceibacterota bacterium]MBP9851310.1 winged helix-turn-helix transcriptional regulator [Candidatus Paceibacterota bacterium]
MKTARQMERHFKGIANHWRISVLLLVKKNPEITLDGIVSELDGNFKTISEHTRKLVQAGLLNKKYQGRNVTHSLSPYGDKVVAFIQSFK